ncbi:MAG: hypothetical protein Q9M36_07345 [Sulfurovum sp.]|nr:hypothetical protein [Sulfurovum sp.]
MRIQIILILLLGSISMTLANNIKSLTAQPYASGYKINLDVSIEDKKEIKEARVYFKTSQKASYQVFAKMKCKGKLCRAILPAPQKTTRMIYYRILYKNTINKVYKGKEYRMVKKEILSLRSNQTKDRSHLNLYTDLTKQVDNITGFGGDYSISTISKNNRLGILAGFITADTTDSNNKSNEDKIDATYRGWVAEGLPAGIVGTIILILMFF